MHLSVQSHVVRGTTVVEVLGEVDVFTAPTLRNEIADLLDGGSANLVIDLGGVTFMDSTGLGILVGTQKRLRVGGGRLVVVVTQENLRKVLTITGLDAVLTIVKTRGEALGDPPAVTV